MDNNIHFGTIGLKIGDKITFRDDNDVFVVSSGNGTPDNGGSLVSYEDGREEGLFSLRFMTRMLLGDEFSDQTDIWNYWKHQGRTLREIFEESNH